MRDALEPITDVMQGVVPRTRAVEPATRCARVALAEDSRNMRRSLADVLRADGNEVREAADGSELLELVAAWSPDLVVTDMQMPLVSGMEVIERLRAQGSATPVILITGSALEVVRDEALARGASAVFPKPFDVDDLRTAVLNLARVPRVARVAPGPSAPADVQAALSRCIVVLRDVALERAHASAAESAFAALSDAMDRAVRVSAPALRATQVLVDAFERFQAQRGVASVMARYKLELAALSVLESSAWRAEP